MPQPASKPIAPWKSRASGLALALVTFGAVAASPAGLPVEKTNRGISYVSGGVGLDESEALKAARQDYSLDIEAFQGSEGKNEYTAAVALSVVKPNGEVLFEAPSDGPYTLLRIAPGRYIVKATYQGQTQQRQVEVGTGLGAKASFIFKKGA